MLLIDQITSQCNSRYQSTRCECCSYPRHCPASCELCLEYIHFPQRAACKRLYDCYRMADYYVCKYAHKYASELVYAFEKLQGLYGVNLKIMSIGCGPCTDLLAIDFIEQQGIFTGSIEYRGIDLNRVWEPIHREISRFANNSYDITFYYQNVFELIQTILEGTWSPNLVVFQYVFSDMQKNATQKEIENFISQFVLYANTLSQNSYIVINDINLQACQGGGRDYFESLRRKLDNYEELRYHFNNSKRPTHYNYGVEYPHNDLRVELPDTLRDYSPYSSCASAQMLLYKAR